MARRLIELDDDLLAQARRALHTTGVPDTVHAALGQAVAVAARAGQVRWLSEGDRAEPDEPGPLDEVRR
jgi:Arc/MetJ family transcription regulator